ncbi:MAG: hypothetical protein ACYTDY_08650 [Planctomycetota bacterium]|jgi:polyferredoxin
MLVWLVLPGILGLGSGIPGTLQLVGCIATLVLLSVGLVVWDLRRWGALHVLTRFREPMPMRQLPVWYVIQPLVLGLLFLFLLAVLFLPEFLGFASGSYDLWIIGSVVTFVLLIIVLPVLVGRRK